jgi:SPP1 gp7 family putative phage head morphogenesis protein
MSAPLLPLPFAEAIAWARARDVLLPEVYYGSAQGLARAQAFTISGLSSLDQIQAVLDSLVRVMETGETFRAWQQRVESGEIPLDAGPARQELIFRNAVQNAANRGRCEQQAAAIESHPWYLYDAIRDGRERPTHGAMDGHVARHDDPVWQRWTPPCDHECRCRRVALTDRQAARYAEADLGQMADPGAARARADALTAGGAPGWGQDPLLSPSAGLRRAIADRAASAPAPAIQDMLASLTSALDDAEQ